VFHPPRKQPDIQNDNSRLKKSDNRLSGQSYAKIDDIIACVNAIRL